MGGSEPERAQCESGRLFFMCEPAYGNLPLTQRAASCVKNEECPDTFLCLGYYEKNLSICLKWY